MKTTNNKKIFIFSGGTGGHVIPSVNFGNYMIKKGYDCFLFVDERGFFYTKKFKGKKHIISSSHLQGGIFFKVRGVIKLIFGGFQSIYYK